MESSARFIFIIMVLKTAFGVNYNAVMILTRKLCSCKMTVDDALKEVQFRVHISIHIS